ncbi:MAG: RNA polymerase sigma factor [Catalinimonas sp.]
MLHPFADNYADADDQPLVRRALDGDRPALDALIRRHQPFLYNVAWKMVHDPDDALDLTQETLLKVITKLAQFNFRSSFRTWLYRIVVNEFLQAKRRGREQRFDSFDAYAAQLDRLGNPDLTREEEIVQSELSEEMRLRFMSGMLLCLTREQRLIYILGEVFGVDHRSGGEVFECSPQNFRVKLHRARRDLHQFMHQKCGLVNRDNPCRCPKKTKALREKGLLDHDKREFNRGYRRQIADFVTATHEEARDHLDDLYTRLYRTHPVRETFDRQMLFDELLSDDQLRQHFRINDA